MRSLLILLIACIGVCDLRAQYDEIFTETWYLADLKHEGVDIDIPSNSEVEFVTLNFIDGTAPYGCYNLCNTVSGYTIIDDPFGTFVFTEVVATLITCSIPANEVFEFSYFDFFFSAEDQEIDYDFSIIDIPGEPGEYGLSFNKPSGDFAFYLSFPLLDNPEFSLDELNIYPNPATDLVRLNNPTGMELNASIYTVDGRKLKSTKVLNDQIEVSDLASGVYFLELNSEDGKVVKRFIKN